MSQVKYMPDSSLWGKVNIPPSKSVSHRLIIAGALSGGTCKISNIQYSVDIATTISAVKAVGASCDYDEKNRRLTINGEKLKKRGKAEIYCAESGSTVRFMIPVAAALGFAATFTGSGRLPERPLDIFKELLPRHGVTVSSARLPIEISGVLKSGRYEIPGNVSSQFITGLLLALPLLEGRSKIVLTTQLQSRGYVDITIDTLKHFGIDIEQNEKGWIIPEASKYNPVDLSAEGDWSQAAFFLNMAALSKSGKPLYIGGLNYNSVQGDRACADIYRSFGVDISFEEGVLKAENKNYMRPFGGLNAIDIDVGQIPDLVPAISVCAAFAKGTTRIYNGERLKIKESNRLQSMADAINAIGGDAVVTEDGLLINGKDNLKGGTAEGANDHRVLMALSAASCRCSEPVTVTDAHSINKSYPSFYEDYKILGGIADVEMG